MSVAAVACKSGWQARLALGYALLDERCVLVKREHYGPLRVQKSLYPEGAEHCHTIVLHPPGGIVGGDSLAIDAELGPQTKVLMTTPGAGKWYKSAGMQASQKLTFKIAPGALLEWLPQENIVFDGARANLSTEVDLAQDALFFGWEITCLGRAAMGECFTRGQLRQTTQIRKAGKPIWGEYSTLDGGDPLLESPIGLAGRSVTGSLILAGKTPPAELLASCRQIEVDQQQGERAGITALPEIFSARFIGNHSQQAKRYFVQLWQILRPWFADRPACSPRIWQT